MKQCLDLNSSGSHNINNLSSCGLYFFHSYLYRISGWDVKKYPRLYDKFHIGDQLLTINDVQVSDLSFTQKLVKNVKGEYCSGTSV